MTTNHDWVYEWLSAIPASTVAPDKGNQQQQQNKERPGETSQQATPKLETLATGAGNRKRRRYFPSPPMSAERVSQDYAEGGDNDEYESSNEQGDGHRHAKRPRQFPDDLDATPTRPTPGLLKRPNSTTTSSLSSARSSTSTSSHLKRGRRGNISPTKGMAALRIEHIIDKRSFTDQQSLQSLPPSLKDMVRLIRRDAAGLGIVSSPDMTIMSLNPNTKILLQDMLDTQPNLVDTTGEREKLGALPPLAEIDRILDEARTCFLESHSEASWNCAVHYPLLYAALGAARVNDADLSRPVQVKATNV